MRPCRYAVGCPATSSSSVKDTGWACSAGGMPVPRVARPAAEAAATAAAWAPAHASHTGWREMQHCPSTCDAPMSGSLPTGTPCTETMRCWQRSHLGSQRLGCMGGSAGASSGHSNPTVATPPTVSWLLALTAVVTNSGSSKNSARTARKTRSGAMLPVMRTTRRRLTTSNGTPSDTESTAAKKVGSSTCCCSGVEGGQRYLGRAPTQRPTNTRAQRRERGVTDKKEHTTPRSTRPPPRPPPRQPPRQPPPPHARSAAQRRARTAFGGTT